MIDIKDVSFSYGGKDVKALNQVSLHIGKGECVLLVGLSGCGKREAIRGSSNRGQTSFRI